MYIGGHWYDYANQQRLCHNYEFQSLYTSIVKSYNHNLNTVHGKY